MDIGMTRRYRILTNWSRFQASLSSQHQSKKPTRIQIENEERIIRAALDVFSAKGYRGSTVDQIAANAGMSKANVLYYFNRKEDIYKAVLQSTLTVWLNPLQELDPGGDPIEELWTYAHKKLMLSKDAPLASRLFANEILQGAPLIRSFLDNELKVLVDHTCAIIQTWIDDGRLAPVSPLHLIFTIWSVTQHYADFAPQIDALHTGSEEHLMADAESTLRLLLTKGLAP